MKTSKIIKYIENMYERSYMEIEITKIKLNNTKFNQYKVEFDYDYMDGNVLTCSEGEMHLDLEKISYFDNSIDWTKNQFYKEKPINKEKQKLFLSKEGW